MLKGVVLVLGACLLWGLFFVVPGYMTGFSPLEVTLGGYFFLGILSCVLISGQGIKKWRSIPKSVWLKAGLYAFVVNIFYYFTLVTGLRYSNASVIALLMGISPITLSFYGNWRQKQCSYRQLVIPSLFIACGLVCVNWEAFMSLSGQASMEYTYGLLCGVFSLIAWNWFVVTNAEFLKQNPSVSSSDWATMIGVTTFAWVLIIVPIFLTLSSAEDLQKFTVFESPLYCFLGGSLVLGLVCSWVGSYLWNRGCQILPIALAGQLTIFETIFGILFFYLLNTTLPTFLSFFGMVTTLTGICLSIQCFRKPSHSPAPSLQTTIPCIE